jgi:hypothetical protein
VNTALGTGAVRQLSATLRGSGPFVAESAQYFRGSPNIGVHAGIAFQGDVLPSSDVLFSDLSTGLADGSVVHQQMFLYNPSATPVQVVVGYFGVTGPGPESLATIQGGGITKVDVNKDIQGFTSIGPLGAEVQIAPESSGSFLAVSVGTSSDGLSATEDSGVPV